MTTLFTPQLQEAVRAQGERPLALVDPSTNRAYVLISQDLYDRIRPIFDDEPLTELEQRRLILDAGRRAGWDDPEMDAYDRYDELHAKTS